MHAGGHAPCTNAGMSNRYALEPFFGPGRPEMITHVPHAVFLGMEVIETAAGHAVIRLPYREDLVGDPVRKVVFGGAITTLLDQASGLAVFCSLDVIRAIATLDLRIDYLRAAEPGRDLIGVADCYKRTRNVAFVRGVAYEDDPAEPFACFLATFMIGANASESPFASLISGKKERRS